MLSVAALVLVGAATGIQPVEVDNVTVRVELNASEIYKSGTQTSPGEYTPSSYPYLSSDQPEALLPYGDATELTNIYMPNGLVAYYPLDETTGNTANDITTTLPNNDGTYISLNQNDIGVEGNISNAYKFDGNNDYVDIGDNNLPNFEDFTVSGWIRPDSWTDPSRKEWLSASEDRTTNKPLDFVHENGEIRHYRGDAAGNVMRHDVSSESGWHRTTVTQTRTDGSSVDLKMYFDGTQVNSASGDYENMRPSLKMRIGSLAGGGFYWDGRIDDVRIYNRSLSQEEVQRLYNYQNKNQPGTEQISATITSGGFILANTKGGTPSIGSRSETVRSRTFLGRVGPSFGFSQSRTSPTTQVTYNSPYNLTGDSFSTTSSSIELKSVPEIGDNATVLVAPTN